MISALFSLIARDARLALRVGGGAGAAIGFLLVVIVFFPLAIGPDQNLLQRIAPGALWIALLLSVLLSADRIYTADYEDGSLEVMALGPAPLEVVALAKALAHWLTTGLPLAVLAAPLGVMLNLDLALLPKITAAMALGSLALSLLAAMGAAITVGLRKGGLLISLLILPLYIPLLIFGISASGAQVGGGGMTSSAFAILGAIVLLTLVVAPAAAAAALRSHLR